MTTLQHHPENQGTTPRQYLPTCLTEEDPRLYTSHSVIARSIVHGSLIMFLSVFHPANACTAVRPLPLNTQQSPTVPIPSGAQNETDTVCTTLSPKQPPHNRISLCYQRKNTPDHAALDELPHGLNHIMIVLLVLF